MKKTEEEQDSWHRMANRIQALSDADLITELKKRAAYRPEAAEYLVQEAIRRGIIHSEEDLQSPDFEAPATKITPFPYPESEYVRNKIVKSLMRSVMIAAIIPIYYGVMKFTVSKYIEGTGLISLGIIWIAMAWFIMEKSERKLIIPMIVAAILSMVYTGRIMLAYQHLSWFDLFVPVILYLIIFYALFYTQSLLRNREKPGRK